jgi:hypothetical protein
MTKRKVELWIHTTSGTEFEIRDAASGEILYDRWSVDDEDRERARVEKRCEELGLEVVGEAWS